MNDSDIIEAGQRVALGIEYTGTQYRGWQRQATADSVQKRVEDALHKILLEPVHITCAGRTDAGVHATAQLVHFDNPVARPVKAFTRGTNTILPGDIAVTWCRSVPQDFHARYSATARRYRYIIYNYPLRSGVFGNGVTHAYELLDEKLMHEAAQYLVGEHDFTSFRAAHCQSHTSSRNVHSVDIYRLGHYIIVDIKANAFLHHMVRNIVGSLLRIGTKEQPVDWLATLLALKDRTKAAPTAKPHGLYLVKVDYPEKFNLPTTQIGPMFLPDEIN
ncbi:tRNA pseudouridine(38-40) synthase TruA [Glaciecola sp. 2405UD65-10]|jgi:tRNA pseudouridine38-40 synthase|uniref:tRNA pseudouridine(38-40) synthase TruA n=1 Tax=Glaciecola sp. 2405UD65-10 TaxID=3397244 RepID=UPI003B5A6447